MANNTFRLEVRTPSKNFYSGEVEHVIATTPYGTEGFMAHHSSLCKILDAGKLRIKEAGSADDEWLVASAAGGFIDIQENEVVIYIDNAEWDRGSVAARRSRVASGSAAANRRNGNV